MKELFLANTGKSLVPVNEQGEEALASYPQGAVMRVKVTQKRSLPHHNFFHAFLAEVLEDWPETHKFKPRDLEHLRGWLLVRVGIREEFTSDLIPDTHTAQVAGAVTAQIIKHYAGNRPVWLKVEGNRVHAAWPASIAFDNMGEEEFRHATTLVFSVIYAEVGIDVDVYYQYWQQKYGKLKVEPVRMRLGSE